MQEILNLMPSPEPSMDEFTTRDLLTLAAEQGKRISPTKVRRVLKHLWKRGYLTKREVLIHTDGHSCRAFAFKPADDSVSLADVILETGLF